MYRDTVRVYLLDRRWRVDLTVFHVTDIGVTNSYYNYVTIIIVIITTLLIVKRPDYDATALLAEPCHIVHELLASWVCF